jgi:hypothetical protein
VTRIGTLVAVACFALAGLFAWAFYVRYWMWRDCIAQALSSCAAEGAGNATDGGRIWGVFAVASAMLGAWALWKARRRP